MSAELPPSHLFASTTFVRVVQLLSLAEAKQEACERRAAVVLYLSEIARAASSELVDWRLTPNEDRFDLLLEIGVAK